MSTEQIYGIPEQPPMPSVLLGKEYQPDRPISETFYQALEEQNPFMTSTQLESYLSNRGKSTSLSRERRANKVNSYWRDFFLVKNYLP